MGQSLKMKGSTLEEDDFALLSQSDTVYLLRTFHLKLAVVDYFPLYLYISNIDKGIHMNNA